MKRSAEMRLFARSSGFGFGRGWNGDLDELDPFLFEQFFLGLGADAADVAGFGDAVVDLQGLTGELAPDVIKIFFDELGHLPPQLGQGMLFLRIRLLGFEPRGRLDGKSGRQLDDVRVIAGRAGNQPLPPLSVKRCTVFEPAFEGMPIAALQIICNHDADRVSPAGIAPRPKWRNTQSLRLRAGFMH